MKNQIAILIVVVSVVLFLVLGGIGLVFSGYGGMIGMMYGYYGSGMMIFGWIYGLLILIALVLLIIWLARQINAK